MAVNNTDKNENMLLFGDWFPLFRMMPAKDFQTLILSMYDYVTTGKQPPEFEGISQAAAFIVFPALKRRQYRVEAGKRSADKRQKMQNEKNNAPGNAANNAVNNAPGNAANNTVNNASTKLPAMPQQKYQHIDKDIDKDKDIDIDRDRDRDKDRDRDTHNTPTSPPQGGARAAEAAGGAEGVDKRAQRFSKPTVGEVEAYCKERKNKVCAQEFVDFYASKGWTVGKSPMKDWKACVRTWEQRREREECQRLHILPPEEDDHILDGIL